MRTYTLKPGAVSEWESRFAEAYTVQEQYSKLGGIWHTDIGALNQIVHIWPYESRQERADIRATAANARIDKWPPRSPDLLGTQKADILQPVQNMKEWGSRSSGVISMSCICTPMLPAT